ncbi:G-type lectin S-receptor-like serine/threonine protein kinase SD2-5-like [Trifolium medium]|uniref:G-type lectin S-receptor-like serine/threonine protein kinase SD2-5-like n=1 Tax=Trifolium medium TaxID=97028 RepID=A0A392QBJ9_9FABA|nr:G-type lectin S-receptor-like serine/threonine protein kinase SD2-5-like [Trifolium medium]
MVKVALWCVQYKQELRPVMSVVVKMLEGSLEIPKTFNPFQHLTDGTSFATHPVEVLDAYTTSVSSFASSVMVSDSNIVCATPIMKNYEIELISCIL